jgi:mannobiose 2-epimerase
LSEGDAPVEKSFNTHLHVLESFTNLLRVWPDSELVHELAALIDLHLEHIYDEKTGHFHPFFDEKWSVQVSPYSFGHDIEAAWLLLDAARVLKAQAASLSQVNFESTSNGNGVGSSNGSDSFRNNDALIHRLETLLIHVAQVTREEGVDPHSKGIQYLGQKGQVVDSDKHWWVQAEAMVGFLYASQLSGDASFGETASEVMDFVLKDLKIPEVGEWYFRVDENGKPYLEEHIVSQWKCPYHNSRAAFEFVERLAVPQNGVLNGSQNGLPNGSQNGLSRNGDSESLYEKNPSHDSSI